MGIDIGLVADLPAGTGIDAVRTWAERALALPGPLASLFNCDVSGDCVHGYPLPIEQAVFLSLEGTRLIVDARTSNAGPGYHDALITALERMAAQGCFLWYETDDHFDETGYFADRDFTKLQSAHDEFRVALADYIVEMSKEDPEFEQIFAGLATDRRPSFSVTEPTVLTLRGPKKIAGFRDLEPASHFPWWEEGLTGSACRGLASALAWTEFPWRSPLDAREHKVGEAMLALSPNSHWVDEVRGYLASDFLAPPQPVGIGYLRGIVTRELPGNWSIDVPGYFFEDYVEEGEDNHPANVYWFNDRTIRCTTGNAFGSKPIDLAEHLGDGEVSEIRANCAFSATIKPHMEDNTEERWLFGTVIADGGKEDDGRYRLVFAHVSVFYSPQQDAAWAKDVFLSTRFLGSDIE